MSSKDEKKPFWTKSGTSYEDCIQSDNEEDDIEMANTLSYTALALKKSETDPQSFETDRSFFRLYRRRTCADTKRLVDRDGPMNQSRGKLKVRKRIKHAIWTALYYGDLFHTLVDAPTSRCIGIILFTILLTICLFAALYLSIAQHTNCEMGLQNYHEAFMFSLETQLTIGYGTQDIFFGDCWLPTIALTIQMCVKTILDAVTIGIIYSRISRPNKRASTIVFSKNGIIRRIRGRLYFMFQTCELRKHQLVSARVRLYAVRHERDQHGDIIAPFQTCAMRLNHPDDSLGGMLLMCLPQVIVHEIDCSSPLMPPPHWASASEKYSWSPPAMAHAKSTNASGHYSSHNNPYAQHDPDVLGVFPGIVRRAADYFEDGGGGYEHVQVDSSNAPPPPSVNGSSSSQSSSMFTSPTGKVANTSGLGSSSRVPSSAHRDRGGRQLTSQDEEEKRMVQLYLEDRNVEVIAIIEGGDAATGQSMQARHSYTKEDMQWDMTFPSCVSHDQDGFATVDFNLFHELVPSASNTTYMHNAASVI